MQSSLQQPHMRAAGRCRQQYLQAACKSPTAALNLVYAAAQLPAAASVSNSSAAGQQAGW
jgi:hypothetical protein